MTRDDFVEWCCGGFFLVILMLFFGLVMYDGQCKEAGVHMFPLSLLGTLIVSTICSLILLAILLYFFYEWDCGCKGWEKWGCNCKKKDTRIDKKAVLSMLSKEVERVWTEVAEAETPAGRNYCAGLYDGLLLAERSILECDCEKKDGVK